MDVELTDESSHRPIEWPIEMNTNKQQGKRYIFKQFPHELCRSSQ